MTVVGTTNIFPLSRAGTTARRRNLIRTYLDVDELDMVYERRQPHVSINIDRYAWLSENAALRRPAKCEVRKGESGSGHALRHGKALDISGLRINCT
jgi:hypothetical protein